MYRDGYLLQQPKEKARGHNPRAFELDAGGRPLLRLQPLLKRRLSIAHGAAQRARSEQRAEPDVIHLWVGGGVVWDSDPRAEVEESWVKARPLLHRLGSPLPTPALEGR